MLALLTRLLRVQIPVWVVFPLLLLSVAAGVAGSYAIAQPNISGCPLDQADCSDFSSFWRAWDIVTKNYVDPQATTANRLTEGAIQGMVDSLGDTGHTRYLPPDIAKAEREQIIGKFEGIGAYINVQDGEPVITAPIEGSPAEQAGIQAGDRIVSVDGKDVRGVSIDELLTLVRGPRGTSVVLTIQRDGREAPFDITVVRDEIRIPTVTWRMLPNQIAHIQLIQFSAQADPDLRQALQAATDAGAAGIVLDLRNNPGGLVEQLVLVASEFMPKGTTILIERDRDGKEQPYTTRDGGVALDIPMAVLVNNNSASAAEILAGALSEAGRARVIGVPTFGTATVLRTFRLDNGGELRLGTSQWLTPNGQLVRGQGITPDEVIELPVGTAPLSPADAAALPSLLTQASEISPTGSAVRACERGPYLSKKK
jgi:carboxyl-terminal processing protease